MRAGRTQINTETQPDILPVTTNITDTPQAQLNQFYIQEVKWKTISETISESMSPITTQ